MNKLRFRARNKKIQTAYQNAFKIFQKNKQEAIVLWLGSKQPLQQQSTSACFIGPVCSMAIVVSAIPPPSLPL